MFLKNHNKNQCQSFGKEHVEALKFTYQNIVGISDKSKLQILFSNWLDNFYYLIQNSHLLNDLDLNSSNDFNIFQIVDGNFVNKKQENLNSDKFKKVKKVIGSVYLKLTKKIYLPGSDYLTSKIKFKASQFAIFFLIDFVEIDIEAENKFKEIISKLNVDSSDLNLLLKLLPSSFFLNLKKTITYHEITLIGSPIALRSTSFMKLLAFGSKINLIGIQHGCNYGLYKFNEFEKFERDISDKYFLWLISPNHVRISRFKNSNMANYNKKTGLYWIGRPIISKYFSEQIPSLKDIRDFENLYNIELIYSCIRQFEFKLIPHIHKESTSHYKILDNKCFFRPNQRLETYLFQNAKILIFDVLNSTLIFFAISSNIPFLILSNNIKQQYKGEFFENFISILKSMKSLYFINEINDFNNELNQLNNDRSYYYKRINLINSIKNDIYKKSFNV